MNSYFVCVKDIPLRELRHTMLVRTIMDNDVQVKKNALSVHGWLRKDNASVRELSKTEQKAIEGREDNPGVLFGKKELVTAGRYGVLDGNHRVAALFQLAADPDAKDYTWDFPVQCTVYKNKTPLEVCRALAVLNNEQQLVARGGSWLDCCHYIIAVAMPLRTSMLPVRRNRKLQTTRRFMRTSLRRDRVRRR
jgi:hypothetical protein